MKEDKHISQQEDKAWDLLGQASTQEVSPMFSRNVLRAIRLEQEEVTKPWWKKAFSPMPIFASVGVAACVTLVFIFSPGPQNSAKKVAEHDKQPKEVIAPAPIVEENSPFIVKVAEVMEDDELLGDFLVAICENPEILDHDEITSIISF